MSKATTGLIACALLGGAIAAGASMLGDDDKDTAKTRHLANQVWIDRIPGNERDQIRHLAFIKHPRGRFGGVGLSSQWRHFLEVFAWKQEGSRLSIFFPQDRKHAKVKARTWACEGEAPEPFELCLELSANGDSRTYYSRKEWVIDANNVEESLVELGQDNPELAGIFEHAADQNAAKVDIAGLDDSPFTKGLSGL